MNKLIRFWLGGLVVGFALLTSLTAAQSASAASQPQPGPVVVTPVPNPITKNDVAVAPNGSASVVNPDPFATYGPIGTLITIAGSGTLLIVRAINEGKKLDVERYKQRAVDAETRADTEIGKVYKKLEDMEKKLDSVIANRDEERAEFENQKTSYTGQILEMEKRHQIELEGVNAALLVEIHARHKIERAMVAAGVTLPKVARPDPRDVARVATPEEIAEAEQAIANAKG